MVDILSIARAFTSSGLEFTAPVSVLYMLSTPLNVEYLESAEHRNLLILPLLKRSDLRFMYSLRARAACFLLLLFSSERAAILRAVRLSRDISQSLNSALRAILVGTRVPSFTWKLAMFIAFMSFLILRTSAVFLG